jgi:hypothetical protein
MAIIFEWDSTETKKRKYRTVEIHRRLTEIEKEEILLDGKLTKELKLERKELNKKLRVVNLELDNKWMYED